MSVREFVEKMAGLPSELDSQVKALGFCVGFCVGFRV